MAVTSGTVTSSKSQSSYVYCSWSQSGSQDIANNKTNISWTAGIVVAGGDLWYSNAVKITGVWINGTKVWTGGTYSNLLSNGTYAKKSGTASIPHNPDGSKTFTVKITGWFYSSTNVSGSKDFELTAIPRVSDLSVNATSVLADGKSQVIATATKKATAFTDVLTVSLGSYSKTITSGTAFTIPMEWNNAISGTSANATVKVETFSGTTSIGSKTAGLTVKVPESVVPVINDLDISEAVATVTNAFGNRYIQNLSQLNVSVDASGAYGSTIRSYSTTLDGVNYIQQVFTSNVMKTAGTLDIKVKVTDSRGRTAEDTFNVTVIEYAKPTITSMVYAHCDSDGTQNSSGENTKITIAGKVYPVENQNTKALKLKYKSTADEVFTERVVTLSDWTFSVDVIINNTDPSVTYEYIAELTDKINASTPETFRVTTGIVVLSRLAGGKGVTLFGEAKDEGFIVEGGKPAKFTGDVTLNSIKSDGTLVANTPIKIINSTDASGTAQKNVPLYIGADNGEHIEIDTNEIMAKATDTTTGHLYINSNGGDVHVCKDSTGGFYINNNKVADHIVETGTSGIWTYEKWASGKVVCYGKKEYSNVAISTAYASKYYYRVFTENLPLTLKTGKSISASVAGNGVDWAGRTGFSDDLKSVSVYWCNASSYTLAVGSYATFHVVGTWK